MPKIKRLKLSQFKQQAADAEFQKNSSGIFVPKQYAAEIKEVDGEENTLDFKISTAAVDRDGDTIAVDGWKLKFYKKNPVVLWAHDHAIPAIGRSKRIKVEDEALTSRNVYPERDEYAFGNLIYRLHKGGFLKAVSVGFIPIKYEINEDRESSGWGPPIDFVQQELLEHSSVNVPANPEALEMAGAKGIDMSPMLEWYESAIDRDLPIERAVMEIGWRHAKAACGKGTTVSLSLPQSVVSDVVAKVLGGKTGTVEIVAEPGEAAVDPPTPEDPPADLSVPDDSAKDDPAEPPSADDPAPDPPAGDPPSDPPADPPTEDPPADPPPADDPAPADPPADGKCWGAPAGPVGPDMPGPETPSPADTAPAEDAAFDGLVSAAADAVREVAKAGRVISGANEDRLRRSRDLLDEVLSQLQEQGDDDDDDETSAVPSEVKTSLNEDGEVVLDLTDEQFEAVKTAALDQAKAEIRWATGALD